MEAALNALHESNPGRLPLSLELATRAEQVGLYCRVPPSLKSLVLDELRDAYPGSQAESLPEKTLDAPAETETRTWKLHLTPDVFPIKSYRAFEDTLDRVLADPLAGLLSALRTARNTNLSASVALTIRPASDTRIRRSRNIAKRLQRSFVPTVLGSWYQRWSTHPRLYRRILASILTPAHIQISTPHTLTKAATIPQMKLPALRRLKLPTPAIRAKIAPMPNPFNSLSNRWSLSEIDAA